MDIKIIGQNIRVLRERSDLTLSVVAQRANITASALSKIEKGQNSAPISTLISVAEALGVSLSALFEELVERPDYALTRKGKGPMVERDGSKFGYAYEALALEIPGKRAEPFILTSRPADRQGLFQHGGQEFLYVLSGKFELTIGEEKLILDEGDSVYFNPLRPHSGRTIGKTPSRVLCLFIQDDSPARGGRTIRGKGA